MKLLKSFLLTILAMIVFVQICLLFVLLMMWLQQLPPGYGEIGFVVIVVFLVMWNIIHQTIR